jgi:hypothetical protein
MALRALLGGLLPQASWGLIFLLAPTTAVCAERPAPAEVQTVDLFDAVRAGQIETQVIPKDSTVCRLLVTNKTQQPLNVRLPAALAAVPVLAQFGPQNPPGNNRQGANTPPQPLGVAPIFGNNNPLNNNRGGPFNVNQPRGFPNNPGPLFNIAPEKVAKLRLPAVCLEFGAPTPRAQMKYELKPLDEVCDKPGVADVVVTLAEEDANQRVVQLAAWHLANGLSWEKLASLRDKAAFGTQATYSAKELQAGKKLAEKALAAAKERKSEGVSASLSAR